LSLIFLSFLRACLKTRSSAKGRAVWTGSRSPKQANSLQVVDAGRRRAGPNKPAGARSEFSNTLLPSCLLPNVVQADSAAAVRSSSSCPSCSCHLRRLCSYCR
jgi:hypothetical protein